MACTGSMGVSAGAAQGLLYQYRKDDVAEVALTTSHIGLAPMAVWRVLRGFCETSPSSSFGVCLRTIAAGDRSSVEEAE